MNSINISNSTFQRSNEFIHIIPWLTGPPSPLKPAWHFPEAKGHVSPHGRLSSTAEARAQMTVWPLATGWPLTYREPPGSLWPFVSNSSTSELDLKGGGKCVTEMQDPVSMWWMWRFFLYDECFVFVLSVGKLLVCLLVFSFFSSFFCVCSYQYRFCCWWRWFLKGEWFVFVIRVGSFY